MLEFNNLKDEIVNGMIINKEDVIIHAVYGSFDRFEDIADCFERANKDEIKVLVTKFLEGKDFKKVLIDVANEMRESYEAWDYLAWIRR